MSDKAIADGSASASSAASKPKAKAILSQVASTIKSTVGQNQNELDRWRKTFDTFAKVEVDGKRCVERRGRAPRGSQYTHPVLCPHANRRFLNVSSFIDAIAPGGDFSKIKREQYSVCS